ncbi:CHASE2 domain-containing protein [Limnofasciculus baicalensis]|uniref:CHASE2 domain-containing protein n=1 Tax=Limnofasciculus baicalensis BBK-W-15 TaxID=2699891 RepID=A0AAE3GW79_9CYAN|nr:CHASE2 domain-containing protein [Limnofasciculus baicalensis]MCP2731629.1 CHASE2 domain-containing protein [Limnofasciculus baicalensis BBK-W-15]
MKQQRPVLITAAGVTGAAIVLRLMGILQSAEFVALDELFRLRPPEAQDNRVVIVEIKETNLQDIGQWPIPDRLMAQLLQKLNTYQPRAIGLDIYRDLPVKPGNEEFLQATKTIPNLIGIERLPDKNSLGVPGQAILSKRKQIGFNNVVVDSDGKVRRSLLYWHIEGKQHNSFALKLALTYLQSEKIAPQSATTNPNYLQLGKVVFPYFKPFDGGYARADDRGYQILGNLPCASDFRESIPLWQRYSFFDKFFTPPAPLVKGGSKNTTCISSKSGCSRFQTVSIDQILADKVPAELLRDRIIIIGSRAPSLEDVFYTPYSDGRAGVAQSIFGVELQASFTSQILSAVLDGRPLIKVLSKPIEWVWIFGWSVLGAAIIWKLRSPLRSFGGILITAIGLIGSCYIAFLGGWWLPLIPSMLGLLGSAIVGISQLAYIQEELKRSKEFLHTVIDTIPDPVFVKDKKHRWIILNPAYCNFVGYSLKTLMGKSDYDIFPPEEATAFWSHDELVFQTGTAQENEEQLTDSQGKTYLIATKKSLHKDAAGNIFLVGVIRDITERKRTEEELRRSNIELKLSEDRLRYIAYHDPLTSLGNRKYFQENLTQSLDWSRSQHQLLALLFLDLDGFKKVNDTLGHDIGDELLKAVADRLKNSLRSSDIVSRLGGDEFTVILPGIPEAKYAGKVAKKIGEAISEDYYLEGHKVQVTTSIGISLFPLDGETEEMLIKKADTAMYHAKKSGRNQHQFCHSTSS